MSMLVERDTTERKIMIFERMVESFIRQWSPEYPREAAEFSAQLTSIVRQTMIDAQEPIEKRFTALEMTIPGPLNWQK